MATAQMVFDSIVRLQTPVTMSEVAFNMHLKPNEINTIISRLCRCGFINKDSENKYLPTQKGIDQFETITPPDIHGNLEMEIRRLRGIIYRLKALVDELMKTV